MSQAPMSPDVTSDDKLWAAFGYPIALVAIIVLFMEDKKRPPIHQVSCSAVTSGERCLFRSFDNYYHDNCRLRRIVRAGSLAGIFILGLSGVPRPGY